MARAPVARTRRWKLPSLENTGFMLVFLGLPLAIYVIFVISPFVQAFYYSMTDWSGFSKKDELRRPDQLSHAALRPGLHQGVYNSIILVLVLPPLVIILSLTLATLVTVGGVTKGEVQGLKHSGIYRVISFFPYTVPAIVIGILWAQMYDPSSGLLNGILTAMGFEFFKSFAWLGDERTAMGASIFVIAWSMVGFYMVLFIAAIKGIRPTLRGCACRWRRPLPHGHLHHRADDPRHHPHRLYLSRHPGARRLRLHAGAQPVRWPGQLDRGHQPAPASTPLQEGQVRLRHLHGRRARHHYAGLCRHRLPRLLVDGRPARWKGGAGMSAAAARAPAPVRPAVRAPSAPRKPFWTDKTVATVSHVALIAWVVIICAPLLWVLMSSFKTTQQIFGSPFSLPTSFNFETTSRPGPRRTSARISSTVIVVGGALIIVMLLGAMCAYYLARYEFKGSKIIYYLMLAGLTFPIFLAVVPLFQTLRGFGLLNTFPGLIITYVAFALPFTVFFLYAFFRTLPQEIAEAAQLDGAAPWRIFFTIMLPMATPALPRWRSSTSSACGTSSCCPSRSTPTPPTTC